MRVGAALVALAGLSAGCAQGDTGRPDASGDGGVLFPRDTGARRDGGAPPTCDDDTHSGSCDRPTDLGPVAAGGMASSGPGFLPATGEEDWFTVRFPRASDAGAGGADAGPPTMRGDGMPRLELVQSPGGSFRFEVRSSCSASLACGDGMTGARDIAEWSFTDDQAMPGELAFSTRDVPWPETLIIRVYRAIGTGDCTSYELRVTR